METISEDTYLRLREGAEIIERDGHGEKVLRLQDGSYLKLFRRKRLISSAAWYPYAQRFADNAVALAARTVPCPEVIGVFRIADADRDAVCYKPLPGKTLRELIRRNEATDSLRKQLGAFVAMLHAVGIYFRSLHLGNIVLTPSGELGLIDIADLRAEKGPLGSYRRYRNLRHLERSSSDSAWLFLPNTTVFKHAYKDALQNHLVSKTSSVRQD